MSALRTYLIALIISLWVSGAGLVRAEKIIFAYPSPSTSFLPLVVAQKKGFFDPENLQPELVQIRPAVAIPGLTLGSVDFTTVLGSTIAARMRGVPLVITGVFADKPMDFLVGVERNRVTKRSQGQNYRDQRFGHRHTLLDGQSS